MKVIPREVKKVITNSKKLRELRNKLKLSDLQKRVLLGTILGDACLIANVWGKNYRLQIEHSKQQKQYVFWKYEIFKEFTISPPKFCKQNNSWRFRTISTEEFTKFYKLFYKDNRKILPYDLTFIADPLVLAVWFMDDGGRLLGGDKINRGYIFNIQNFDKSEAIIIRNFFGKQLKIPSTIQKNKRAYRLFIRKNSMPIFRKIIDKYILKDFRYKLF